MFKIFLNKKKSKDSVNKENNINVSLKSENNIIPLSDIVKNVNEYEQYVKEKKNSQTYRLSFNITPLCSNVLFNKITEIVYHEGADDCVVFNKKNVKGEIKNEYIKNYCEYKGIEPNKLYRDVLIRDTGFSHLECGGLAYRCGYDIFNNHTLRKKEFNVVNKLGGIKKENFNTLLDYRRDKDGKEIENWKDNLEENEAIREMYEHLYMYDTVHTFDNSVNENLIEKNGWVGFINPVGLNIPNYKDISLNKCMNNNKACEMIDMYPDRSLFSFVPKINKYRENRIEKNWDYCLTYPFENFYDNDLVSYKCKNKTIINGLKVSIVEDIFLQEDDIEYIDIEDGTLITLKTSIKHNFTVNSMVNIVLIGEVENNGKIEEKVVYLENNEKVTRVGFENKHEEYYFSIYGDELFEKLNYFKAPSKVEIRVRKVSNGGLCKYYFRKFRRIPNFNNTNVYNDGIISNNEIKEYSNKAFNSTLNGLGFSRTIYNDNNAQLIFNDNIELKGLKDNLGRNISEIYLTIIKNNKGYKEWYEDKDYTNSGITNSRCFGKVTSGVDMLDRDKLDYNIHVINNVSPDIINYDECEKWKTFVELFYQYYFRVEYDNNGNPKYTSPGVLEDDINEYGGIVNGKRNNDFLGDIVEFNENTLTEYTLTEVLHRFNTVQREILDEEYRDLIVDEILSDDYDLEALTSGFTVEQKTYNEIKCNNGDEKYIKIPFNIDAEGYFYKPHYKIVLKEYKETVKQGEHTRIAISEYTDIGINKYMLTTSKNYYFELLDNVYFYDKITKEKVIGTVYKIEGKNRNNIFINVKLLDNTTIDDYIIYRPNSEKPYGSYELEDGSGRYLWRDLLEDHEYDINGEISKYIFTNNAHYINKQIIFKLQRQDPTGEYKISSITGPTPIINNFGIEGVTNDYSNIETMLNDVEDGLLC